MLDIGSGSTRILRCRGAEISHGAWFDQVKAQAEAVC